jgi:hypothetical protein
LHFWAALVHGFIIANRFAISRKIFRRGKKSCDLLCKIAAKKFSANI